jgi:hypothetical protein
MLAIILYTGLILDWIAVAIETSPLLNRNRLVSVTNNSLIILVLFILVKQNVVLVNFISMKECFQFSLPVDAGLRETNIINGSHEVNKQNGKLPLTNGNGLPNAPSGSVGGRMTGQRSHEQSTDDSRLSRQNQQTSKKQTTEVKMRVTGEDSLIKAYETQLRAKEREEQEAEDDNVNEQVKYLRTQHTVVSQG